MLPREITKAMKFKLNSSVTPTCYMESMQVSSGLALWFPPAPWLEQTKTKRIKGTWKASLTGAECTLAFPCSSHVYIDVYISVSVKGVSQQPSGLLIQAISGDHHSQFIGMRHTPATVPLKYASLVPASQWSCMGTNWMKSLQEI